MAPLKKMKDIMQLESITEHDQNVKASESTVTRSGERPNKEKDDDDDDKKPKSNTTRRHPNDRNRKQKEEPGPANDHKKTS